MEKECLAIVWCSAVFSVSLWQGIDLANESSAVLTEDQVCE